MQRFVALGCVVFLLASPAVAKDSSGALAGAKRLAKAGKYIEAVEICAEELKAAQKKKDLPRQFAAWRTLDSREFHPLARGAKLRADHAKCLKLLMMKLDPKTTSGVCSAGQVAHALLFHASRTGDATHVAQAVEVVAAYAKLKTGRHAKSMGDYATGMDLIAAGKAAEACRSLSAALGVAKSEGWSYTAVHIGTELAAAHLAAGAESEAKQALATTKTALDETKDRAVFQIWQSMVKTRLPDAPETVLAPFEASAEDFGGAGMAGAAGGRGGTPSSESKVGGAWKKLSKKKPFVSVLRTGSGFRMTESFDKHFEKEKEFATGVKHVDDGGITVAYFDRGVALVMLDLRGNMGQPGEASEPGPFQFFTPLAEGETWGITKAGTIIVK